VVNTMRLVDKFGEALKRIQGQTIELARVTREGVMSGWFEITRVAGTVPSSTTESTPPLPPPRDTTVSVMKFDHRTMENVFQGFGRENGECVVMCTIEFGVNFVRKVVLDEDSGMVFSPVDSSDSGVPDKGVSEVETMVRRRLVKPKVLLENVIEILR